MIQKCYDTCSVSFYDTVVLFLGSEVFRLSRKVAKTDTLTLLYTHTQTDRHSLTQTQDRQTDTHSAFTHEPNDKVGDLGRADNFVIGFMS